MSRGWVWRGGGEGLPLYPPDGGNNKKKIGEKTQNTEVVKSFFFFFCDSGIFKVSLLSRPARSSCRLLRACLCSPSLSLPLTPPPPSVSPLHPLRITCAPVLSPRSRRAKRGASQRPVHSIMSGCLLCVSQPGCRSVTGAAQQRRFPQCSK